MTRARKSMANVEIRELINKKGIRYYEAAEACGVTIYTFSHWLQTELKPEKRDMVLRAIQSIKA